MVAQFEHWFLNSHSLQYEGELLFSIVVGIGTRAIVIEGVGGVKWRTDGLERDRNLAEVEAVEKIVSGSVGITQRRQAVGFLDEFEDAAKIMGDMRDVAGFGVGRDDDQRNTKSVLVGVEELRWNMVVPATPIVP